ncbi:glutaminase family protein [Solirubrum puertoriconensis]|uniref:Glutaminase n=1 Tax=Solirubrum puertoriconensis TaxID=1751427 RepID=A0A9X0HM95_SOLP1|nr:glutaminase family protein [Solirubrum puertoriconensis]KUG08559.1 glutaminase [Solirubrum puertoriconensis]
MSAKTLRNSCLWLLVLVWANVALGQGLRAPAYPLVTIDPYTSVWAFGDQLYGQPTKHWTGRNHNLLGMARVDGRTFTFLGSPEDAQKVLAAASETVPQAYRFTTNKPADNWMQPNFDDKAWEQGAGLLATEKDERNAKTHWQGSDVWLRRTVTLKEVPRQKLKLYMRHDDDVEVYLNGVPAFSCAPCFTPDYLEFEVAPAAAATLRKGANTLAVHCKNTGGPGTLDVGLLEEPDPSTAATATQRSVRTTATQTLYEFACGPVQLEVAFTSPLLLDDLEVLSRPVSYITMRAKATDGRPHAVQLYLGASPQLAVNFPDQAVAWQRSIAGPLTLLRTGTQQQNVLGTKGDNVRIDWGYLFLAADNAATARIAENTSTRSSFKRRGTLPKTDDARMPRPANQQPVELALVWDLGKLTTTATSRHALLGYDDLYSVEYFGQRLRPWWRRNGASAEQILQAAEQDYERLMQACNRFDTELAQEARAAGGEPYAELCALAYRQAIAAHKTVAGPNGTPLFFSKENFSNGSIGTVDVTYPSAPLFLRYNPTLLKGMLDPIFYYTESGRWKKEFAAHDVGTYPVANGQTYGEDMPVEESGNMLILTAAIAAAEGNASYAKQHWPALTQWADYLKKEGFNPDNQLCTDDFAGHLAHNANLSVKAILGLASYGRLAGMLGDQATAAAYQKLARDMARQWMEKARDGNDHYRLTFDNANTWSQKYNLVWDKLLRLEVFPPEVARTEVRYYLGKQQPYGLPLDSRRTYTKSDWIVWTATLADSPQEFQQFIGPLYRFVNETPDRIPLSDWHETTTGKAVGFRARSVVGGYFIKMLEQRWAPRRP